MPRPYSSDVCAVFPLLSPSFFDAIAFLAASASSRLLPSPRQQAERYRDAFAINAERRVASAPTRTLCAKIMPVQVLRDSLYLPREAAPAIYCRDASHRDTRYAARRRAASAPP